MLFSLSTILKVLQVFNAIITLFWNYCKYYFLAYNGSIQKLTELQKLLEHLNKKTEVQYTDNHLLRQYIEQLNQQIISLKSDNLSLSRENFFLEPKLGYSPCIREYKYYF